MSVNDSNNISRTDWTALEAMTDEEIDYSEIPPLTEEFFEHATLRIPANLDLEVMKWYQSQETDHKTLIYSVLRCYMEDNHNKQAG